MQGESLFNSILVNSDRTTLSLSVKDSSSLQFYRDRKFKRQFDTLKKRKGMISCFRILIMLYITIIVIVIAIIINNVNVTAVTLWCVCHALGSVWSTLHKVLFQSPFYRLWNSSHIKLGQCHTIRKERWNWNSRAHILRLKSFEL